MVWLFILRMELATILLLAVGVSADAFAVAVGRGAAVNRLRVFEAFRLALFFGAFQAFMPVLGWLLGHSFSHLIVAWDHWLAFVLLGAIGGKMIFDDWRPGGADEADTDTGTGHLLLLALATSIDALAVGVGLVVIESITAPALIIGAVTFKFSLLGVFLGHRFKGLARSKSKTVGGLILIAIGAKILVDHLGIF